MECVVRLQGQAVNPADYTEELCRGFADIKSFLSAKLTDTPEKPEKDSRTYQSCRKADAQKKPDGIGLQAFLAFLR